MAKTKKPTSKITKSSPAKSAAKKSNVVKKAAPAKAIAKSKKVSKPAKKAAAKPLAKTASKKPVAKAVSKKAVAKPVSKPAAKTSVKSATAKANSNHSKKPLATVEQKPKHNGNRNGAPVKPAVLSPFFKKQRDRLLTLRDSLLDAMNGVARDALRSRAEGSEASAFGMHQADAGSDAYDRDFALSLLSQEQDALYEIDEALKRLQHGVYGVCEISGKGIPHARLEAIPFARYTVECQSQIEKQNKVNRVRLPVSSLFGLTDDEGGDRDEEESSSDKE